MASSIRPDLVYLAWNRLEYTVASFNTIIENTNWDRINHFVILDDGSMDGTTMYLEQSAGRAPVPTSVISVRRRSPVASMNRYLESPGKVDWFFKLDNDVCVPPGWLDLMLDLAETIPDLDLLGMEAGITQRPDPGFDGSHVFEPATHIGGIGLMRTATFGHRRMLPRGRFGFTEWQWENAPVRGWITPDLPVVLLDRLPTEPWRSLGDLYRRRGWQREWPLWDEGMRWAYDWFVS